MSVLLISGSPSQTSSGARLLHHIGDRLAAHGHQCSRLQVRDLPPAALLHADVLDPAIVRALAQVAAADAIVIATPIYQASFAGGLKCFLDLLPQAGLDGKLVLPVATGGSQSHLLALDAPIATRVGRGVEQLSSELFALARSLQTTRPHPLNHLTEIA